MAAAVDRAEAVVDEGDARTRGLDRGREDGDAIPGHVHGGAEELKLLALDPLFGELPVESGRPGRVQRGWWLGTFFGHPQG
jgi:hypothetical protein